MSRTLKLRGRVPDPWDVHKFYTTHADPPKVKYIVAACVDTEEVLGFFINTRLSRLAELRPERIIPCIVELDHSYNTFLQYRSFLDCSEVKSFLPSDFTRDNYVGTIYPDYIEKAKEAVRICKMLRDYDKMRILGPGF